MKKLNRKGFTLVELLAIIVILAVILVVAIPPILDAMDNSKRKSLENSAKSVASGWSNNIAAAQLDSSTLSDNQKAVYLNWAGTTGSNGYKCLTTTDAAVLSMDVNNYVFGTGTETNLSPTAPVCSMAKVEGTAATVVLVVKSGHQMYLADAAKTVGTEKYMWASSDGTKSW